MINASMRGEIGQVELTYPYDGPAVVNELVAGRWRLLGYVDNEGYVVPVEPPKRTTCPTCGRPL